MKKTSILIIDDSEFLSNALRQSFEKRGFLVTQVFDVTSAREMLRNEAFDYALLDLELPDGKGEEVLPSLQIQENIRVIVLTTSRDTERRKAIFSHGGVIDYITKERYFSDMELAIVKLIEMITTNEGLSILVVDDSKLMQTHFRTLLSKRNYKVTTIGEGKSALALLEEHHFDAVVLDLEMPVMDGNKLMSAIKRQEKHLQMPVMVVSGTSDPIKIAKALKNGAYDFVRKPFVEEELILKIDKMMQDIKQQRLIKLQQDELKRANLELELANQKVVEISEAKSLFLSTMSHEIRTPLNAILGFIAQLKKIEKESHKYKLLDIIDSSSKTLTNIINDILDLSKIESGNFKLDHIDFDPCEEFNNVLALFEQSAQEKGVVLVNSISADLPKHINSDILRLKQIIANLLSNAIKFTPESKHVELRIDYDETSSMLQVAVADEGIGISADAIQTITEAFTQAESSTARKYGGTGLGLSIVEKLLALLHSRLQIESEIGEGSRFHFEVPVMVVDMTDADEADESLNATFEGMRVLVADDNKTNQMLMELLLDDMQIHTVVANNGVEAEARFEEQPYDAVLMDINMPERDGVEAMHGIKAYEKQHDIQHPTPIIALTANSLEGDEAKYLAMGFDGYLSKPIEEMSLIRLLNGIAKN